MTINDETLRRLGQHILATTKTRHAVCVLVSSNGEVVVTCDHNPPLAYADSNRLVSNLLQVALGEVQAKIDRPTGPSH